jgi:small-conductance mechanosensitive channel
VLGWIAARILLPRLAQLFTKSSTQVDDIILGALRPHVPVWFALLGLFLGARYPLAGTEVLTWVDRAIEGGFILSVTLAIAAALNGLLSRSAQRWGDASASSSLVQNALRIVVISLGVLVIAGNMGIAITPVLTALGVGSLAVALALQPTLANLFAGFQITLARKIRIGDYIELESGEKGFVVDIDWRTTQLRELPNNLIMIPNSKLAELIVRNYSLPEDEQSVIVGVGVSYESDLAQVEEVTIDVARKTLKDVTGAAAEFDPFIRYNNLGDSSIDFSVILRVRTFSDRFLVAHEFIKRLHKRYNAEGIEIPFPQRVVTFTNAGAATPGGGEPA